MASGPIKIITEPLGWPDLIALAQERFGDLVKAVVDVRQEVIAAGGELHADEEALLIESGSQSRDLWGFNLYPGKPKEEWIEFDSIINLRPSQNNRSRGIEDPEVRERLVRIVERLIPR